MNEITNITGGAALTMTSIEIATLCEKRHDNVVRDIKIMCEALNLDLLKFEGIYTDAHGRDQKCIHLPKRETMILVSGYKTEFRAKIIDRLEMLEKKETAPALDLNNPAMLRHLLLENVEKVLSLDADVKELTPLAASYNHLTRSDGTMCVTDAAKALNQKPKDLFLWLQANRWIYRRAGNGHWVGYQAKIQSGMVDHRLEEVTTQSGTKIKEQVRITAKGMARLGEVFALEAAQ